MTRLTLLLPAILLLLVTPACRHFGARAMPETSPVPVAQARESHGTTPLHGSSFTPGNLRPEEIATEIAELELTSRNPLATAAERTEALRRLAVLHLLPNNPSRSLALAAKTQEAYLQSRPHETARQEGEIWLALILEKLDRDRLLQQNAKKNQEMAGALANLDAEKQRLAQKLAAQEAINTKLKGDIEKLKFIDLSVEKKRKNFR